MKHIDKKNLLIEFLGILIVLAVILAATRFIAYEFLFDYYEYNEEEFPDWIDVQIVPVNGVGRSGVKLETVNDIVIHYVGNPGTTAQQNRDYYAAETTEVSSHFIVGLEGEIVLCVPLNEKSSATNWRNSDTISIETCHPDETGAYTSETYASMIKLTAWLCSIYDLDSTHIIRHGDVTGKNCPKLFMEDESAWEKFKADVETYIDFMHY